MADMQSIAGHSYDSRLHEAESISSIQLTALQVIFVTYPRTGVDNLPARHNMFDILNSLNAWEQRREVVGGSFR